MSNPEFYNGHDTIHIRTQILEPSHNVEQFNEQGYSKGRFIGQTYLYVSSEKIIECGGIDTVWQELNNIFDPKQLAEFHARSIECNNFFSFEIPSLVNHFEHCWDTEKENLVDQIFQRQNLDK